MRRSGRLRSDLVAWIFEVGTDALQMREGFAQCAHVRQMERHMIERLWRGLTLLQSDRDVLITNGHAAIEFELRLKSKSSFPPLRALARVRNRQSKMSNRSGRKWDASSSLLRHMINVLRPVETRVKRPETENPIFIESKDR